MAARTSRGKQPADGEERPSSRAASSSAGGSEEARITIHPRITRDEERHGLLLARQRGQRPMTFWSDVITVGLPLVAALTEPDEDDRHGPWTGKQLARKLRLLVAQLIEFQVQHDEIPSSLALLLQQRSGDAAGPLAGAEATPPSQAAGTGAAPPVEVFASPADPEQVQHDLAGMGFGKLSILDEEKA